MGFRYRSLHSGLSSARHLHLLSRCVQRPRTTLSTARKRVVNSTEAASRSHCECCIYFEYCE